MAGKTQTTAARFTPQYVAVPPEDQPLPNQYPQAPRVVSQWEAEGFPQIARPLTLLVNVYDESTSNESEKYTTGDDTHGYRVPRHNVELITGVTAWTPLTQWGGQLIVTYGSGAVSRRIVADLKSGSFQIPPCTFARVEAAAWGAQGGPDVTVTASFSEGVVPSPARFTFSYRLQALPAASFQRYFDVPDGARWVQLLTTFSSEDQKPIVEMYAPGVYVLQDYDAGQFMPPGAGPYEMGSGVLAFGERPSVSIRSLTPTPAATLVRFYLEI